MRATVAAVSQQAPRELFALAGMEACGDLADCLPDMDLFSVDKEAHTTNWEWRGEALAGFSGPSGGGGAPLMHMGALPTMPGRNFVIIVRPMTAATAGAGEGRLLSLMLADKVAEELLSRGLVI